MAISSSVWRTPSLPTQRSPTLPLRELPHGRQSTWDPAEDEKKHDHAPHLQKKRSNLTLARSSVFFHHGRQLTIATKKALALPRRVRRPTAALAIGFLVLLLLCWWLAGQTADLILYSTRAAIALPGMLFGWGRSGGSRAASGASTHHIYHPNGYLLVNPNGKHPILSLIERAEREWKAKVDRQSKTLEQAVSEYKRRYRRNPPRGFDKWWDYVQENNVLMPDEYDQIDRDFRAYWALDLEDLRHRNRVMQGRDATFTLCVKDGQLTIHGEHATLRRATDIGDIVRRFAHSVPTEVNMTFIIEDQPAVMMTHERRHRMHELAHLGEQFGPSEFFQDESDSFSNYALSCPPSSPLRKAEQGDLLVNFSAESGTRSFIWDHVKSMDLCQHPEWRKLHGLSTTIGVGLGPLVPLFTFAKMTLHDDILATPLEQYWDQYDGYDPEWSLKTQNRVLWRGTTTGADFTTKSDWRSSQRARLHFMSHEKEGLREVMTTVGDHGDMKFMNATARDLNALYMDTAFAGGPAQCDEETCRWLAEHVDFAPTQGLADSYQYKYMIDVDGNGWSGRFHRLMSTRSLVLKTTIFPEWYADRLQPWYHYVPVKIDYSDLYDIMTFFVGSVDGHGGHDNLAAKLAENGRLWAGTHWRRVDMASYMFRLVLEYGRLLSQDDAEADYLG